jgi:pilus assembly protein Flp/PilA
MVAFLKNFVREEDGATMVEYALLVSLISIAAIVALVAIGPKLQTMFSTVSTKLGS